MKKNVLLFFITILAVLTTACGTKSNTEENSSVSEDNKLIVGTEAGFAPYEFMEGDKVVGIDMDIAQAIADEMGKELEIKNMDFTGALLAVQQGKIDFVAAAVSVDEERKQSMDFSTEYVNSTDVVVVNKDNPAVTNESELKDKTIGVQQGNIADIWVTDTLKAKKIKRYTKFVQASEDLKNNKIDCIVMDVYPAEELVDKNNSLEILKNPEGTYLEVFSDNYAIAVKKGNTELLDEINKVIEQLKTNGKIEEFTAKYTKK